MAANGRYVTIAEFIARFDAEILKELTSEATAQPSTWTIDEDKISSAIAAAESKADTHIAKRYKVPLTLESIQTMAARQALKRAVMDLALYNLYKDKGLTDLPAAKSLFAGAIDLFKSIAEGTTELPGAEPQARKRILYSAPSRIFGRRHCVTNQDS